MEFTISASTDVGTRKGINQDSLFVRRVTSPNGSAVFAVLCDGMGGLEKGELASATVIRAYTDWMFDKLPGLLASGVYDQILRAQWCEIAERQNAVIAAYGQRNSITLGTTATILLVTQTRYYIMNVGDSRAYILDNSLRQITRDHTLVMREVEQGKMTLEEAERSPRQNVLTQCIGASPNVVPDMFYGDIHAGMVFMLCSDGFRHLLTRSEIYDNLCHAALTNRAETKRREEYLIDLNKQRGETDNISVLTVRLND